MCLCYLLIFAFSVKVPVIGSRILKRFWPFVDFVRARFKKYSNLSLKDLSECNGYAKKEIRDKMLGTVIIMYNLEDQLSCDSLARVDHPFCASVLSTFFDLLRSAPSLILKSFKLFGHNLGTIKPNNWTIVQNWQYSLLKTFNSTSLGTKRDSLFTHIEKGWLLHVSALNSKVLSTSTSLLGR